MSKDELEVIKEIGRLPKDELDGFWENFSWYSLITLALIVALLSLYHKSNLYTDSNSDYLFVIVAVFTFLYTIWSKKNERNLAKIQTNLKLSENRKIIDLLVNNPKWIIQKIKKSYWEITVTSFFGIPTHKLVVIAYDKEILLNFRNLGSHGGRTPFSLGMDSYRGYKFKCQVKNYLESYAFPNLNN
jgi:hypothetical protein